MAEKFDQISEPLKSQLDTIYRTFLDDEKVQTKYREYIKRYPGIKKKEQRKLFKLSILKCVSAKRILQPRYYPFISCYSEHSPHYNDSVQLLKLIKCGKHACVMEGLLEFTLPRSTTVVRKPVIVKWYQSPKRNISYECDAYRKLEKIGCPVPWYSTCYRVWDNPVLVMEKLVNLGPSDNEYLLGIHVLNQLRFLHSFAVHCDIKPQNIMKRETEQGNEYLLIDYGGISRERLRDEAGRVYPAYRRWVWSEKWSSQKSHVRNQPVTCKADFIELGYTMQAIQNWRKSRSRNDGEYKTGFVGKLDKYMAYVRGRMDETIDVDDKHYDALIRILSK